MNFGPPALCPPCCFLLLIPTTCLLPTPYSAPEQPFPLESSSGENKSLQSCGEERILVTREDLLQEGYGQNKRAWTEEEDQLLLQLCASRQSRFEEIAAFMPGRNAKMCYSRYRRLTNQSKDCWSRAENQKLASCVALCGPDWRTIAPFFPNRNYKQLKDHYENYLRPNLLKEEWTVQDDLQLIALINQHGKNWRVIGQGMPGRSRNQLKNRLFGRIKRIQARKIAEGDKLGLPPL